MSSVNTNTSAMTALQTLRNISSSLDKSQQQVSSGLRVGKAADNAAYWSIATTMKSDNKALSAVSDSIGRQGYHRYRLRRGRRGARAPERDEGPSRHRAVVAAGREHGHVVSPWVLCRCRRRPSARR
jgi:flagellin